MSIEDINNLPTTEASLEFTDIENALNIIDFACAQGAFKGWDMILKVYAARERLSNFVTYARSVADAAAATDIPKEGK